MVGGQPRSFDVVPRLTVSNNKFRICPGMHFAEDVFYSAVVALLATSTLLKPLDGNGEEYAPPASFTGGFLRCVI